MNNRPATRRALLLIYLEHFFNDIHINFLQTFLPVIIERLGISIAQAGVLTALPGLFNIFLQPAVGYLSDLTTRPLMIVLGPLLTAFGASLLPVAPSYGVSLLLVGIWGLGGAIFHPQGQGAVGYIGGGSDELPLYLSFFSISGILASAISPLYAMMLVRHFDGGYLPVVALLPVSVVGVVFLCAVPRIRENATEDGAALHLRSAIEAAFRRIWRIWLVTFIRDMSNHGIKFLLPLLVTLRGGGIGRVGAMLFAIQMTKTISPLFAGRAAMRFGRRRTLLFTQSVAPILLVPAIFTGGWLSMLFFMIGSATLTSSSPVLVAGAQELVPKSKSMASSMIMGLAYGLGGLMMAPVGLLADGAGVVTAFLVVVLLPLATLPLLLSSQRN